MHSGLTIFHNSLASTVVKQTYLTATAGCLTLREGLRSLVELDELCLGLALESTTGGRPLGGDCC